MAGGFEELIKKFVANFQEDMRRVTVEELRTKVVPLMKQTSERNSCEDKMISLMQETLRHIVELRSNQQNLEKQLAQMMDHQKVECEYWQGVVNALLNRPKFSEKPEDSA